MEKWLGASTVDRMEDGSLRITLTTQGGEKVYLRAWPGWAESLADAISEHVGMVTT